jgi:hypothetical protein
VLKAQVPSKNTARLRRAHPKPLITGVDGTQTGTASFMGNFTTITTPSGALSVFREPDCSLTLATGTYTIEPDFMYTKTDLTLSYERVLHTEAQLTTAPDVFASGCAIQPTAGFGSAPGIFVGNTTGGISVFAGVGEVFPAMVEGVYLLTGTTTFDLSSFQDSTVSNLTAGDLNKDGNGDLVLSDNPLAGSARVTVMLGKSDGTFKSGVPYPIAGNYSVAAVIDDVNGDGKLDIVAVSGDQQISVLLGKGDGTFQDFKSFAAPALPGYASAASTPIVNMITADLRGNNKKDIICSNGLVLLGNGDGTFTAVATPAFPYFQDPLFGGGPGLSSGDVNKDGKIDLVVDNSSTISTWLGNGDGTFTQGQSYATISTDGFISVQDLDGDGNPDVFVGIGDGGALGGDPASTNLAYALLGNGNDTFQGAPQIGFGAYTGNNLADVTGSGTLDLITNTVNTPYGYPDTEVPTFTVQLGNGKGAFNPVSTITPPASFVLDGTTFTNAITTPASTFAVGDITGDGKADLVFADNDLTNSGTLGGRPVYFTAISDGNGTFAAPTPHAFPQIAPSGDFDNSATISGMQITNFTKGGNAGLISTFYEIAGGTIVPKPYSIGFVALPGNGDGTFGAPVITTLLSSATAPNSNFLPVITAVADVNNDGNPDLVVINNTYLNDVGPESQVEVFIGNGDGSFKAPIVLNTPANPTALVLADFNHDNKLDMAVMCGAINANVDQLAILLGNGDGTFGAPTILNVASDINGGATLAAADFNDDNNIDIALFNPYGNSGIFYGSGNGTFTSVNTGSYVVPKDLINLPVGGPAVAVNFTGDAKPAILVGNTVLLGVTNLAPVSQTITFPAIKSQVAGSELALEAMASSGLAVSFAPITPKICTVAGTTASLIAAGTCTIEASQGGDSSYTAATPVNQSFTVAFASQTITFPAIPGQLGGTQLALSATASSGLAVKFSSTTTKICKVSGTTASLIAAGTCTIEASQAGNGAYHAAPSVKHSFTVARASQTITFPTIPGQIAGTKLKLEATASSDLKVSFSSTTTKICKVSGTTASLIKAGTCTIEASQGGDAAYHAAKALKQSFKVSAK